MNLSLVAYLIALAEFTLTGIYKFHGLDWYWLAFCALYMMTLAIWFKIQ